MAKATNDGDSTDDVDCSAVVQELYTFLDGELTERRKVQIERHYSDCPDCHEVVAFHAELKISISEKCRENVPDELRARIASALGLGDAPPRGIRGI